MHTVSFTTIPFSSEVSRKVTSTKLCKWIRDGPSWKARKPTDGLPSMHAKYGSSCSAVLIAGSCRTKPLPSSSCSYTVSCLWVGYACIRVILGQPTEGHAKAVCAGVKSHCETDSRLTSVLIPFVRIARTASRLAGTSVCRMWRNDRIIVLRSNNCETLKGYRTVWCRSLELFASYFQVGFMGWKVSMTVQRDDDYSDKPGCNFVWYIGNSAWVIDHPDESFK